MMDYNIDELVQTLRTTTADIVLFGAGDIGKLAHYALGRHGIEISYFCDNSRRKQGTICRGVMTISPDELRGLDRDAHVFVCGNYVKSITALLERMNFRNIRNCVALLESTDFSGVDFMQAIDVERKVALHKVHCLAPAAVPDEDALILKYIDVVITEACSMKCQDCSNLMQYYAKPRHSDLDLLFRSIDRIMNVVDGIYEFRVLGGEPFMNKEIHRVIEKLSEYDCVEKIVIYTNATIVPKGRNLECLRNDRVVIDITNYGEHSVNYDRLIATLEENNVAYMTKIPSWTDSGRILYRERSQDELETMFMNCCVNDVLTLLNGKLYRCPFSANGTNLGSIPYNSNDAVDLTPDTMDMETVRTGVERLYRGKSYLTACSYCNGRDYSTPKIEAAIQISLPLPLPQR